MLSIRNKVRVQVCCQGCGRETRNVSALCAYCLGHGRSAWSDQRGRAARNARDLMHELQADLYGEEDAA